MKTIRLLTPIKNERVGLGMLLLRDQIGITDSEHLAYTQGA
jgi:hypothetical protein